MKTFAQIVDGRVHWVFQKESNPYEQVDGLQIVDITGASPAPAPGWTFADGVFTPPPPPPAPGPLTFATLDGDAATALLIAVLGIDRTDGILATRRTVQLLLARAKRVDRLSGNTPSMLAFLKSKGDINDADIAAIDAAWPKAPA